MYLIIVIYYIHNYVGKDIRSSTKTPIHNGNIIGI